MTFNIIGCELTIYPPQKNTAFHAYMRVIAKKSCFFAKHKCTYRHKEDAK